MSRLLACLILLVALPAAAQIYKYTDANGNTAYSNQPPEGRPAQTIELAPLNSVQPQTVPKETRPRERNGGNQGPAMNPYDQLQLTDIPTEEALRANNGTFTVGVGITPALQPSHMLQLVLDGTPYGQPSNVPRLQLVNIDRGEHRLSVNVLDRGVVVQQSAAVTFTVQRVHVP